MLASDAVRYTCSMLLAVEYGGEYMPEQRKSRSGMREGAPSTLQKVCICNECSEGLDTWEIILLKILSVGQTFLILY